MATVETRFTDDNGSEFAVVWSSHKPQHSIEAACTAYRITPTGDYRDIRKGTQLYRRVMAQYAAETARTADPMPAEYGVDVERQIAASHA